MNNKKHRDYVREMMVVFTKKDEGDVQQPTDVVNPDQEYIVSDPFSDMANSMIQNFTSTINGGAPAPATHIAVVDNLGPSEDDTGDDTLDGAEDDADDDNPDNTDGDVGDQDQETAESQNQIMFDLDDNGLVIKFDDTELHLSKDAVTKLKAYLSDIEDSTENEE